jgi:hypothetical protein
MPQRRKHVTPAATAPATAQAVVVEVNSRVVVCARTLRHSCKNVPQVQSAPTCIPPLAPLISLPLIETCMNRELLKSHYSTVQNYLYLSAAASLLQLRGASSVCCVLLLRLVTLLQTSGRSLLMLLQRKT